VANVGPLQPYPTQGDEEAQLVGAFEYARWGRRAVGLILDVLVIVGIALLITAVAGHKEPWEVFHLHTVAGKRRLAPIGSKLLFFNAISALVSFVYDTAFLCSTWQATLGMRAISVHIAREDLSATTWSAARWLQARPQGLGRVGVGRAAARSAIYAGFTLLARLPFGIVALVIDFLWPLWDGRRQTLHDKFARTVVLRGATPR
jgi:uncharacterized RDD family membrane protein YckC